MSSDTKKVSTDTTPSNSNLKEILRHRILEGMIKETKTKHGCDFFVLVLDRRSSRIVSSCCRMFEITEVGLLALNHIGKARQPLDEVPAIYFIEPSEANLEALAADLKKTPQQYQTWHVFFTSPVPKDNLYILNNKILAIPNVTNLVKTMTSLNTDFLACESRVFSFDRPKALSRIFLDSTQEEQELRRTASELATLCRTLNEKPIIRYQGKPLCQSLANFLTAEIKSQFANWEQPANYQAPSLLIVDRTIDPVAPLLHEYTYQAIIHDLLPVQDELLDLNDKRLAEELTYYYPDEKDAKEPEVKADDQKDSNFVVLSEEDSFWIEHRHTHIAEVSSSITAKYKSFITQNAMAQLQTTKQVNTTQLREAMRQMPMYKELMRMYCKHMTIVERIFQLYDERMLEPLSELEQDLATGFDSSGSKVSASKMEKKLTELIKNPNIGKLEKLRLILIYVIGQGGIGSNNRDALFRLADTSITLQRSLNNLTVLGVDIQVASKKATERLSKERQAQFKSRLETNFFKLMRFVPVLHEVINAFVSGTLSNSQYKSLGDVTSSSSSSSSSSAAAASAPSADVTSLRSKITRGLWRSAAPETKTVVGPRYIIFVIGGVTFSEVRSAYEIAKSSSANVLIGSTEILTPNTFLRALCDLKGPHSLSLVATEDPEASLDFVAH